MVNASFLDFSAVVLFQLTWSRLTSFSVPQDRDRCSDRILSPAADCFSVGLLKDASDHYFRYLLSNIPKIFFGTYSSRSPEGSVHQSLEGLSLHSWNFRLDIYLIKAKGKNMLELRKAGFLEYLFADITVSFSVSAEVTPGQCLAFGLPEFRDKVTIQFVDSRNGVRSSRILDPRCVFCVFPEHKSQEGGGAKENAANGFSRIDGAIISGGGPLHGYRLKSFGLPQNLQDSFRSGVPFNHHDDAFIPQFFHLLIIHCALPYP
jgi:hypothetical protein